MHRYFVRIGAMADVHSLQAPSGLVRGRRMLVRTGRGVELAEVIAEQAGRLPAEDSAVRFLRQTTAEDEMLLERLERHKREAVEACREALANSGSPAVLLDVDQIFDGGTLLLHYLGPVDPLATSATRTIVERYESIVRSREFAQLLSEGCGPGCGTGESSGCGGGCDGCSLATACQT